MPAVSCLASSNRRAVRRSMYSLACSAPYSSAKMPWRVVRVVKEEQHVAQADQHVGAVPRGGQGVGRAVNVAHHVDPHEITIEVTGQ